MAESCSAFCAHFCKFPGYFVTILQNVTNYVTISNMTAPKTIAAPRLADKLLSQGITSTTPVEISAMLKIPQDQVRRRLNVPTRRGEWVTPAHGLRIPVPYQYRSFGAPEGIELIDSLMQHFKADYYIGWLSAAEIHGAAHHAPQVFQVATSRQIRNRKVGRTNYKFYQRSAISELPVEEVKTQSGTARISSRELTLVDLSADLLNAGGLANAVIVFSDLIFDVNQQSNVNEKAVVDICAHFPVAVARRIGWLIEKQFGGHRMEKLHDIFAHRTQTPSLLDPASPRHGTLDRDWNIIINNLELESF